MFTLQLHWFVIDSIFINVLSNASLIIPRSANRLFYSYVISLIVVTDTVVYTFGVFQMFAALSVMTACAMAIPIFVEGGPRSQSSESAENYVSI